MLRVSYRPRSAEYHAWHGLVPGADL